MSAQVLPELVMTRAPSTDSILSAITVDDSNASIIPSSSSTPPTSIGDSASVSSTSMKLENTEVTPDEPSSGRSRRVRTKVGTYNVKVLSGTAIHMPKKFRKDLSQQDTEERRRTISGDTLVGALKFGNSSSQTLEKNAGRLVSDGIDALDLSWSISGPPKSQSQLGSKGTPKKSAKQLDLERRRSTRSAGEHIESFTKKITGALSKKSRKSVDALAGLKKAKRELRNLADTPEFAKIDTKPVVHEVWSNGKLVVAEPPRKKKKIEAAEPEKVNEDEAKFEEKRPAVKKEKVWLKMGLYAGQDVRENHDWFKNDSLATQEKMKDIAPYKPNGFMPLPMWHGQRLLQTGRDFKLPFDVCNPLPPGQPKPDEWRKTSSNRFIGNAAAQWKKSSLFDSFNSKCVCTPARGCDENCQNRIMLYECDDTNCGAGEEHCSNRAFSDLQKRRKLGGKYRIGVEVIKTTDRGYGVRSNRCFEPQQIIVEYTGEIITEEECDRRMNEEYKNNECYYLMSFDQCMIIDATKGSIARFVNHSCNPNCRMVKWIVGGKPRMALFAGDNPIMSGDELTYDYNFDPFSAKNVQECRCGSHNCRGVLGPKPKDVKPIKESVKDVLKAGKRKLKDFLGMDEKEGGDRSPKKRKMKTATGVKRSASSASMKLVTGAAKSIKKSISSSILNVRQVTTTKRVIKKTAKASEMQTYGKSPVKISSRQSSLTFVASSSSSRTSKGKTNSLGKRSVRSYKVVKSKREGCRGSRGESSGTIRVVTGQEDEDDDDE